MSCDDFQSESRDSSSSDSSSSDSSADDGSGRAVKRRVRQTLTVQCDQLDSSQQSDDCHSSNVYSNKVAESWATLEQSLPVYTADAAGTRCSV